MCCQQPGGQLDGGIPGQGGLDNCKLQLWGGALPAGLLKQLLQPAPCCTRRQALQVWDWATCTSSRLASSHW